MRGSKRENFPSRERQSLKETRRRMEKRYQKQSVIYNQVRNLQKGTENLEGTIEQGRGEIVQQGKKKKNEKKSGDRIERWNARGIR